MHQSAAPCDLGACGGCYTHLSKRSSCLALRNMHTPPLDVQYSNMLEVCRVAGPDQAAMHAGSGGGTFRRHTLTSTSLKMPMSRRSFKS